jgi:hypothetical protein
MSARRRNRVLTWPTLGAALVAEVAVWALLEAIVRTVGRDHLDTHLERVWYAGRGVVRNTQALHVLSATQQRAVALVEELERQQSPAQGAAS